MRVDDIVRALEELGCANTTEVRLYLGGRKSGTGACFSRLERQGLITCLGDMDLPHGARAQRWRLKA